jgi:hypothetical protein
VDFESVRAALVAIDFRGPLILETPRGADALASARANLAFARDVFSVPAGADR